MRKNKYQQLIICLLVILLMLLIRWLKPNQIQEDPAATQNSDTSTTVQTESVLVEPTAEAQVKPYQSPIDFQELQRVNPDTIAWIKIPGTDIDYPIVQGNDNDYYLHTDFEGNRSKYGSIYLDYESDPDLKGRNHIIYGHNMKNGSMFRDLVLFKDESFFNTHRYFEINTPERTIFLKAMACYYDEAKPVIRKTKFATQVSFDRFVNDILSGCSFAERPQAAVSSVYILVTCSYEVDDARTFLIAMEVDESGDVIPAQLESLETELP